MFFQTSSQTSKGLIDTYSLDANDHSDADEDIIRTPKRKRATQSPPACTTDRISSFDGAIPSSLKRKAPRERAEYSAYALETDDDDSDEVVNGHGASEPKQASKKRKSSLGVGMGIDAARSSIDGGSSKEKPPVVKEEKPQTLRQGHKTEDEDRVPLNSVPHVRFETPHERDTRHDERRKSRLKRKSIGSIDEEEPAFVPQSDDSDDSDDSVYISQIEKSDVVFDFSTEKARRWTDAINLPEAIYNEAEQDLLLRLSMRGFEPILPSHWKFDFPTLPLSLFPDPRLGIEPLLEIFASEFYAIKSLANLFSLGGRVRDCKILRKKPEPLIRHSIKDYIRWAMRDAKVCISKDAISLHAVYAQQDGIMETLKRLDRRLHYLVGRYQEALGVSTEENGAVSNTNSNNHSSSWLSRRKYPILIGFIVSGPTVVILTRNSDPTNESENSDSTFMCQFDLGERGQDVWNSLAIAITVMHIRRTMMQLAEDEVAGYRKLLEGEKSDTGPDLDL